MVLIISNIYKWDLILSALVLLLKAYGMITYSMMKVIDKFSLLVYS